MSCFIKINLDLLLKASKFMWVFWLHWGFLAVCLLSLVSMSRHYSLVVASRLLIVVASLVAEHGL